jgi:hypothetical protein
MRDTVQGIGNGLPFFGRSAVVKGENALPVAGVDVRTVQLGSGTPTLRPRVAT